MRVESHDGKSSYDVVKVSFRMTSETLQPDLITQQTNIQPTWSYAKGELSAPIWIKGELKVPPMAKPWGMWAVEYESSNVESTIRQLLTLISPKSSLFEQLKNRFAAEISIGVWWEPSEGQGGYTLPSNLLIQLASLGERIDFYFAST